MFWIIEAIGELGSRGLVVSRGVEFALSDIGSIFSVDCERGVVIEGV